MITDYPEYLYEEYNGIIRDLRTHGKMDDFEVR